MKPPQLLRSRIVLYFCGYLAILLTVYSGALIGTLNYSEDQAFNRQVSEIAVSIQHYLEENGQMPVTLPLHITAYPGLANVPAELQQFVADRPPGAFEVNAPGLDSHVALVPIPSTGETLAVFYDVKSIEKTDLFESFWVLALTLVGLGVLFLGWILARYLADRILTPISDLAAEVKSLSLVEGGEVLHAYNTRDEVGTLAETVNQLSARISEFTRREREFTSHASHELRTPVTVIKGAVEILKSANDQASGAIQRPLARIERAAAEIEMLTSTFLLLARQDQIPDEEAHCDLSAVVTKVVETHRYLLEAKPVEAHLQAAGSGSLRAPASLVRIAVGNLVRNAFQYTLRGRIEITVLADRVSVCDSGPGIDSAKQGPGVGLTIVERLCERMNWRLALAAAPGGGTRADLIFTSSQTDPADPAPAPA